MKIETTLLPATKKELIDLLQDYSDMFTLSYQDMLGLDTDIVVHCLPLKEECLPHRSSEMLLKIKEEVKK